MDTVRVRDAATLVVIRDPDASPSVLMGQRGNQAAFMPDKYVFPGGAMDAGDDLAEKQNLSRQCAERLKDQTGLVDPSALAITAIRELWEETGLVLGTSGNWSAPSQEWRDFAATEHVPDPSQLRFIFRAITPPGPSRRFDARFFLAPASAIQGDLDDFSRADLELRNLTWVPLEEARNFDLPFVTQLVLAEVMSRLPSMDAPETVPFFKNDEERSLFVRLGGKAP